MTHAIGGVLRSLPWAFLALQAELVLVALIAYQVGKRKGLNSRAEVWKEEYRQAQFALVQAEERLAAEKRVSKRLEVIVSQFSRDGGERLRLVEGGGK